MLNIFPYTIPHASLAGLALFPLICLSVARRTPYAQRISACPVGAALPQRQAHLAAPVPPLALTARPLERRFPRRWSSNMNTLTTAARLHSHACQQRPTPTPSPSSSSTTATAVPGRSANSPSVNSPHISVKRAFILKLAIFFTTTDINSFNLFL